ncbi:FAD binding domain-containing protein [Chaetomidium leptoderma]|uniref:FAD binding domain-containing protein n=1 Tax=Chaetomidium leptoderma TaxID=669021 RepID=A0AAN6VJ70_9PEZI|nr:FAD binding domain-containing protein [Chaetomidium leptoderma]
MRAVEYIMCESVVQIHCKGLVAAGLDGKVFFPNEENYQLRMASYWSTSAALRPWCMILPATAHDVSITIDTLVQNKCPFGVRGGGHGSFALSSSVEHGVTIDFGAMNGTTYDPQSGIASLGPGGRWQDVYETLAPHGVTVTGGRAGSVGVGGFLTGDGNSFHSASHGMACDTVVNFEVVLGNGSIVNANANENPDLWVALKGGSGNLGLVTRFDLDVIKFPDLARPDIWGGFLAFDPSTSTGHAVIDAMAEFAENAHLDQNTSSIMYFGHVPAAGGDVLHLGLENTLGIADPPATSVYQRLEGIMSTYSDVVPMTDLTGSENPAQMAGFRNIWFTLSFKNDARAMKHAAELHKVAVQKLEKALPPNTTFTTMCSFQPLNKVIADHGVKNGGNVMGLDYWTQSGNGILFLAELRVNGANNEARAYPIIREWAAGVEGYAKKLGVSWGWKYLNYAAREQDPLSTIGPDALRKLRDASAKYDPHGVFQTLRMSGFKIPVENAGG